MKRSGSVDSDTRRQNQAAKVLMLRKTDRKTERMPSRCNSGPLHQPNQFMKYTITTAATDPETLTISGHRQAKFATIFQTITVKFQ